MPPKSHPEYLAGHSLITAQTPAIDYYFYTNYFIICMSFNSKGYRTEPSILYLFSEENILTRKEQ